MFPYQQVIPNLNLESERVSKRSKAAKLMRIALDNKDALSMAQAAEIWRDVDEFTTAIICEKHVLNWQKQEAEAQKRKDKIK